MQLPFSAQARRRFQRKLTKLLFPKIIFASVFIFIRLSGSELFLCLCAHSFSSMFFFVLSVWHQLSAKKLKNPKILFVFSSIFVTVIPLSSRRIFRPKLRNKGKFKAANCSVQRKPAVGSNPQIHCLSFQGPAKFVAFSFRLFLYPCLLFPRFCLVRRLGFSGREPGGQTSAFSFLEAVQGRPRTLFRFGPEDPVF